MKTSASLANPLAKVAFVAIFAVGISRAVGGIVAHAAILAVMATSLHVEDSAFSVANHVSIWWENGKSVFIALE